MRSILPALLVLTSALHAADKPAPPPHGKLPAISLLPDGSELKGVMLPRYDENHKLTGVLKAVAVTLVNDQMIAGKKIAIGFFNPDGSQRGHIDLKQAVFNQVKGLLEAAEPVTIQSDRFNAKGSGLYYAFRQGEGFLTGPATTWIQPPPTETTMNSIPSPLRAASLLGIALVTQAAAVPPPVIGDDAGKDITSAGTSTAAIHSDASRIARMDLRTDLEASAAATAKAKAFLEQADLVSGKTAGNNPPPADPKPLEVIPGPKDTVVMCDGGMYFDADKGVFVYLKNVRVTDPRFTLSGANELKIFLSRKPDDGKPKPPGKDKTGLGLDAKFGDVERIIATGAVRILQKEVEAGKQPVEASGAIFSYHPDTGEILLSGGYPWVKNGTYYARAKEPNLTLRIQKSGSFVTEGNWEMGGTFNRE